MRAYPHSKSQRCCHIDIGRETCSMQQQHDLTLGLRTIFFLLRKLPGGCDGGRVGSLNWAAVRFRGNRSMCAARSSATETDRLCGWSWSWSRSHCSGNAWDRLSRIHYDYAVILPFVGHSSSTQQRSESGQSSAEPQATQHSVKIGNILLLSSTSSSAVALFFLSVDVCISWKDTHAHKEHAKCVSVCCCCYFCFLLLIYNQRRPHLLPRSLPSLLLLLPALSLCPSAAWRRQRFMLSAPFTYPSLTLAHSSSVPPSLFLLCAPLSAVSGITAFQSRFRSKGKEW